MWGRRGGGQRLRVNVYNEIINAFFATSRFLISILSILIEFLIRLKNPIFQEVKILPLYLRKKGEIIRKFTIIQQIINRLKILYI